MITTWGYALTELNTLPDMLSLQEFNTFTGGKYSNDSDRVSAEISAASAAIRNFVGWHLAPSAACRMSASVSDRRVTFLGRDVMIQLPARFVTGVTAVSIGGVEYTEYIQDINGILIVYNVQHVERYAQVVVDYTAGISDDMIVPIKELIAHRVTHAVAVPSGITQEASGGVSVTYNANWINNSRATALAGDNKELLVPYKVQGVF